jgi:hypothetical protein
MPSAAVNQIITIFGRKKTPWENKSLEMTVQNKFPYNLTSVYQFKVKKYLLNMSAA